MPLTLAHLSAHTKPVTFSYDGEEVTMQVRHHLITPRLAADLEALQDEKIPATDRMRSISQHLARLVASWDLMDGDGSKKKMFPLEPERLETEIPLDFQANALLAAVQALQVGEKQAPGA